MTDDRLIFLISQPRSGSTLVQRMLACHPDVFTMAEPLLMYHPFVPLGAGRYQDRRRLRMVQRGVRELLQVLPEGTDDYMEGVRRMYGHLYARALEASGKSYLCDKSPAYTFVLPELYRTFPDAHYVVLLRNPLATLHSVVNIWAQRGWWRFGGIWDDLLVAPGLLVEGIHLLGSRAIRVRYEDLVSAPDAGVRGLCAGLGLNFVPEMIEYGQRGLPRTFGDPASVYAHDRPAPELAHAWVDSLRNPQFWRLAKEYLARLDAATVEEMGYSYRELTEILESHRPPAVGRLTTVGYEQLRRTGGAKATPAVWDRAMAKLQRSLVGRGLGGTFAGGASKLARFVADGAAGSADRRDLVEMVGAS